MATPIEQQLIQLLQPLLTVPLRLKGEIPVPEQPYAELSLLSCAVLGMDEVAQRVDDNGNLPIRSQRRSEVAIHYCHSQNSQHAAVEQLSQIIDGLSRIATTEQFQLAQLGVEGNAILKTEMKEDAQWTPNSETYLSFAIHYTVTIDNPVGVIEFIQTATDGSAIRTKLMR